MEKQGKDAISGKGSFLLLVAFFFFFFHRLFDRMGISIRHQTPLDIIQARELLAIRELNGVENAIEKSFWFSIPSILASFFYIPVFKRYLKTYKNK